MASENIPEKSATIEQFIASNKGVDELSYFNTSMLYKYKMCNTDMIVSVHNILDDYMDYIEENILEITLNDDEYNKYVNNPNLMAYDVYGSVELEFVILRLNHISSPADFIFKKIRIIPKDILFTLLNDIISIEKEYIDLNRTDQNITVM